MYLGSVRFFKHLILTGAALLVLVPTTCAIGLAYENHTLRAAAEASAAGPEVEAEPLAYQSLYPELYAQRDLAASWREADDRVYLTFNGGPSATTERILDVLKTYNVPATFFVMSTDDEYCKAIERRILQEGHALGILSGGGMYEDIYQSVDTYLADFAQGCREMTEATGSGPLLVRFPGGSVNGYNQSVYQPMIAEVVRRGYIYHDWNVCGDEDPADDAKAIARKVVDAAGDSGKSVVLLHDRAKDRRVADALPGILNELMRAGREFGKLDETVKPFIFNYTES